MNRTMAMVKDAALNTYVTLCSTDARRIRSLDAQDRDRTRPKNDERHIRAALDWLLRAQAIRPDGGISAMFSLVEGWLGSYPETTGYIIPTLFDCARRYNDEMLIDRAVEAADWLRSCQMSDGAFPASFADCPGPPRVFNTGQIILGLVRADRERVGDRFINAAVRAGDWLIHRQDEDGVWRRATLGDVPHAYNVRTAWALVQLSSATGETRYRDAALAAAEWTLSQQCHTTAWFKNNAFDPDADDATLHTIGYCMRGLLEVGVATGCERLIEGARRSARALHEVWKRNDFMAGAFRRDWSGSGRWRCLPGEAQLAIVWLRLDQTSGSSEFSDAAAALLERVKAAQLLDESNPDLWGGVTGSCPIGAPYERYCLVNWGAKFLIDALILKGSDTGEHPTG